MSSKEFCESGKHSYNEVDIVQSIFGDRNQRSTTWTVVACSKCDSKFLRGVSLP